MDTMWCGGPPSPPPLTQVVGTEGPELDIGYQVFPGGQGKVQGEMCCRADHGSRTFWAALENQPPKPPELPLAKCSRAMLSVSSLFLK